MIRRWLTAVCVAVALAGCGAEHRTPAAARKRSTPSPALVSCPEAVRGLGSIAFTAEGRVELVDLGDCTIRGLARGAAGEVRFSPDRHWVAYSRTAGGPGVVRVSGGSVRAPLGGGILAWSWAPSGASLYGINRDGELVEAAPGGRARIVASGLVTSTSSDPVASPSPDGRLIAVDRSRCNGNPENELDTITAASGARRIVLERALGQASFAGWSPDGRWLLYWVGSQCSASIAADGLPLETVRVAGGHGPVRAVSHMLVFADFLSWCGRRLIAAAGPSRETQLGSALVATAPPAWHQKTIAAGRRLSWVSPACATSGSLLAAAAGPSSNNAGFGFAHRSIWLLTPGGRVVRQLTIPPADDLSDEAPRFSRDGHWILFVRSEVIPVGDGAISHDTIELVPAAAGGPAAAIPIVEFTSGDSSFYDHFNWPTEVDWSAGR